MLPSAVWAAQPTAQHDVTARLRRCGVAMRLVRRGPEGAAAPRRASLIHSLALSVGASTRAFSFVRGDVRFVEGREPSARDRSWPILFSNSGPKRKLSPCNHRFHCSLRGRRPASASWCQKALTDQC